MKIKLFVEAECSEIWRCAVYPNCSSCVEKMLANCDHDRLYNIRALRLQPGDAVEILRHPAKAPERTKVKEVFKHGVSD